MLSALSDSVYRWRRLAVVLTWAVGITGVVLAMRSPLPTWATLSALSLTVLVTLGGAVLSLHEWTAERQPQLLVRGLGRAFEVRPHSQVLLQVMLSQVALQQLAVGRYLADGDWLAASGATFHVIVAVMLSVRIWRSTGLELRPVGLHWGTLFGSVTVPWEALANGSPARPSLHARQLPLGVAQPELIQRRGWGPRGLSVPVQMVHPWFLSDVVRFYAQQPQRRQHIGSRDEYEQLLALMGVRRPGRST